MTMTGRNPNAVNKTKSRILIRTPVRTAIGSLSLAALLTLAACGGGDSEGTDTTTDAPTASASSGGPGGFDAGQLKEVKACLKAAGLDDKLPTGQPSGVPSDLPSDLPTNLPSGAPTGFPTDLPSDFPTDLGSDGPGSGGGAGMFQDPEVQDALQACGIELSQAPGQN